MFDDGRPIRSIMVHVVPRGDLRRTARTATIMRDKAIVIGQEKQHLRIPIIRRQRPAVMEHDRLRVLWTPVAVICRLPTERPDLVGWSACTWGTKSWL